MSTVTNVIVSMYLAIRVYEEFCNRKAGGQRNGKYSEIN